MSTKKSTVEEILNAKGLKIEGWETVNAGFGIQFPHPIIVNKKTKERISIE